MTVAKPSPKTFIFDLFEYMHQISMFLFRQFLCMRILFEYCPLREKCPHSDLFWSIFSRIRIEYREIRGISPYSPRMRENADQNNSEYGHFSQWSCAVPIFHLQKIVNQYQRQKIPALFCVKLTYATSHSRCNDCQHV